MNNISVEASKNQVLPNESFTITVKIATNQALVGWQFTLAYDPKVIKINSVTEGAFLKQNGNSTYFSPGTIDNTSGTVKSVVSVITATGRTATGSGVLAELACVGVGAGDAKLQMIDALTGNASGASVKIDQIDVIVVTGLGRIPIKGVISETTSGKPCPGVPITVSVTRFTTHVTDLQLVSGTDGKFSTEYIGQAGSYIFQAYCAANGLFLAAQSPNKVFSL